MNAYNEEGSGYILTTWTNAIYLNGVLVDLVQQINNAWWIIPTPLLDRLPRKSEIPH